MASDSDHPDTPILLLGAFPPQAQGIPGYCGALAKALARSGGVHALGFRAMYPRWLFPGVKRTMDPTSFAPEAPGLRVIHALAWYNPLDWWWHAWRTRAAVVHIQWWSLPLFPVCITFAVTARLRGKPVVVTVHNVLPHEPSRVFLLASRLLCRLADHLIVHSEVNREQLLEHFPVSPDRITCAPMGIDVSPRELPEQGAARERLGIPDRPTLLFFGTIRPYKGVMDLLRALALLKGARVDVQLLIAGKPWESWEPYAGFVEQQDLTGCVHTRLDYIPEEQVDDFLVAADLVVLPYTHFDAQSAVGAQVLGAGRPLLVTETGGLPTLVGNEARWIAPPRDAEALAQRIGAYLEDRAGGEAAFTALAAAVRGAMSWEASAEAHWAIYRALGEGKRT